MHGNDVANIRNDKGDDDWKNKERFWGCTCFPQGMKLSSATRTRRRSSQSTGQELELDSQEWLVVEGAVIAICSIYGVGTLERRKDPWRKCLCVICPMHMFIPRRKILLIWVLPREQARRGLSKRPKSEKKSENLILELWIRHKFTSSRRGKDFTSLITTRIHQFTKLSHCLWGDTLN